MRVLVACSSCQRQYDASVLGEGSRFRCECGSQVTVPRLLAQDAAVVRCSSCAGPRHDGEATCRYCKAEFTLRDQDLDTVCATCMARVSGRGRYCHHCGTAIASHGKAGTASERDCPACGSGRRLNSRALGQPPVPLLECPRCAGLWIGRETLDLVLERARTSAAAPDTRLVPDRGTPPPKTTIPPIAYRRCPICAELMNRTNYGRRSGVIVDVCSEHGAWFDTDELESVLRWVQRGHEERAQARERAATAREASDRKLFVPRWERMGQHQPEPGLSVGQDVGFIADLLTTLFSRS